MSEFDDLELDPVQPDDEPELAREEWTVEEDPAAGPKRLLVILLVAIVLLGMAAAWWWWSSIKEATRLQPAVADTAAERPASPPADEPGADPAPAAAIELAGSDEVIRRIVGELSEHPRLASWLVNDGLVDRFVRATANVAYDEDPRAHVPFMRPGRSFEAATTSAGEVVISPESYRRYATYVDVLASLDAEGSAELFRRLEPAMEEAFGELGYPGSFRDVYRRAVDRVLTAEPPPASPALREGVLSYRFADPELESASPLEKLLVRMGPDNVRRLQVELRRLDAALGAEPLR